MEIISTLWKESSTLTNLGLISSHGNLNTNFYSHLDTNKSFGSIFCKERKYLTKKHMFTEKCKYLFQQVTQKLFYFALFLLDNNGIIRKK